MNGGEFEIKTESIDIKEEWQINFDQPNIKNENEINDAPAADLNFVKCEPKEELIDSQDNVEKDPLELGIKYNCNVCNKSFAFKTGLSRHIKVVHEGIKKYECETCNKVFAQSEHLNSHQSAVHEGIKKYECKTCDKAFSQLHSLKDHQLAIHDGVKHACHKPSQEKKCYPGTSRLYMKARYMNVKSAIRFFQDLDI